MRLLDGRKEIEVQIAEIIRASSEDAELPGGLLGTQVNGGKEGQAEEECKLIHGTGAEYFAERNRLCQPYCKRRTYFGFTSENSTRRFFCRPAPFLFEAMGLRSPKPFEVSR